MRLPDLHRQEPGFDALADIMLGLVAVVLLAPIVIIHVADIAFSSHLRSDHRLTHELETVPITIDGTQAASFIATRSGLLLAGGNERIFTVSAVVDGPELGAILDRLRNEGRAVLLFVQAGGHESAFHFEARLAREGHTTFSLVRIDSNCGFTKGNAKIRYCGSGQ